MDSFIRESQRLAPQTLTNMARYIDSDITLSNGQILPQGCSVVLPLYAMNRDPDIFEDPEKFDGERFLKLQEVEKHGASGRKSATKWGLLDIHHEANVNFGYGNHLCPGRFLAMNTVRSVKVQ